MVREHPPCSVLAGITGNTALEGMENGLWSGCAHCPSEGITVRKQHVCLFQVPARVVDCNTCDMDFGVHVVLYATSKTLAIRLCPMVGDVLGKQGITLPSL